MGDLRIEDGGDVTAAAFAAFWAWDDHAGDGPLGPLEWAYRQPQKGRNQLKLSLCLVGPYLFFIFLGVARKKLGHLT